MATTKRNARPLTQSLAARALLGALMASCCAASHAGWLSEIKPEARTPATVAADAERALSTRAEAELLCGKTGVDELRRCAEARGSRPEDARAASAAAAALEAGQKFWSRCHKVFTPVECRAILERSEPASAQPASQRH